MSLTHGLIQKFFFRKLSGKPKASWLRRAGLLGEISQLQLAPQYRNLSLYMLSPKSPVSIQSDQTDSIVLFAHPLVGKGKFFFTDHGQAKLYLDRGIRVVAFDFNGFGESPGRDLFYWRDTAAAIQYLHDNFPTANIILHGLSFGAFHSIKAIESLPPESRVVIENVNRDLFSYWKQWRLTRIAIRLLIWAKISAIIDMDVKHALTICQRDDIDFLFIACDNDPITPTQEMRELYDCLRSSRKNFCVIANARHLEAAKIQPALYQSILFDRPAHYA